MLSVVTQMGGVPTRCLFGVVSGVFAFTSEVGG
jgi:hypothetical protein